MENETLNLPDPLGRVFGMALNAVILAASDGSGLTLDLDMDSSYLGDAGILRLPVTILAGRVARFRRPAPV